MDLKLYTDNYSLEVGRLLIKTLESFKETMLT